MLIRVIMRIPEPAMDGFDLRHLHVGHTYLVGTKLGRYLVRAGYAVQTDKRSDAKSRTHKGK